MCAPKEVVLDSAHPARRNAWKSARRDGNRSERPAEVWRERRVPTQAGIDEEQRGTGGRMRAVESKEDYRTGPILPRQAQVVQDQSAKKVASRLAGLLCVEPHVRELQMHDEVARFKRAHGGNFVAAPSRFSLAPGYPRLSSAASPLAPLHAFCIFCGGSDFSVVRGALFYTAEKPEKSQITRSFTHLVGGDRRFPVSIRDTGSFWQAGRSLARSIQVVRSRGTKRR